MSEWYLFQSKKNFNHYEVFISHKGCDAGTGRKFKVCWKCFASVPEEIRQKRIELETVCTNLRLIL